MAVSANILHHSSSENLSAVPDSAVSLTVTSPPYWNAIDYDIHANDSRSGASYRTRAYAEGYSDYRDYLSWISGIFGGVLKKTKPGGLCAIVVGTVLLNGTHYPLPFHLTTRLVKEGWQFHQDIIWHKVTAGVRRFGSFIQHPYPGYFYPNIMTEYILLFRKPGPRIYDNRTDGEKDSAAINLSQLLTNEIANNVWHIAPIPPGHLDHPCPFPEEIPFRLILLYSYPGDLILDPFAGSGQTLKVAHNLGRRYVGYETKSEYVNYAKRRATEPLNLREEQLMAVFKKTKEELAMAVPNRSRHRS